jgi:SAM-dependent methyltransferase
MSEGNPNLIDNASHLNLDLLRALQEKPEPFTPGEKLFWNDPHISKQMLATHLDPTIDLASRRPETIDRTVAWIVDTLDLSPGDPVLDLGCGPGLYTQRFAHRGLQVSGMDYSRRSIEYAKRQAAEHGLDIHYRYQNYLTLDDAEQYKAAFLIFGDFCPLSPEKRARLLRNVHRALLPGGHFVLDVSTREGRMRWKSGNRWYVAESGFWKPGWHLVLEQGFDYAEQAIYLDQFIVIEAAGKVSVYRNWFQDYSRESITEELEENGFIVESVWSDLTGIPYEEDTQWIGVVARKGGR